MADKLQQTLSHLLSKGEKLVVPADQPFVSPLYQADLWPRDIAVQYVAEKMDLPQYFEMLMQMEEFDGRLLLSLSEDIPVLPGWTFQHSLHKAKLNSHIERLRTAVLKRGEKERKSTSIPMVLKDWQVAHVASWLQEENKSKAVSIAFRHNWNGEFLAKLANSKNCDRLPGFDLLSADARSQLQALAIELLKKEEEEATKAANKGKGNKTDGEEKGNKEKPKKEKKSATAMKKRRKLEQILQAANEPADDDDAEEDEKDTNLTDPIKATADVSKSSVPPPMAAIPEDDQEVAPPPYTQVDSESKKAKKAKKPPAPVDDTKLSAEANNLLQEAIKKNEALLKDRQLFYDKIDVLQETILNHEENMKHLQRKVKALTEEKTKQEMIQAEYFNSSKAAKKLVDTLLKDRDIASKELDKVMGLYQRQMMNEEKEVKEQIDNLQRDILLQHQDKEVMDVLNAQLALQDQKKRAEERKKPAPVVSAKTEPPLHQLKDGDSDLEDDVDQLATKLMLAKTTGPANVQPPSVALNITFPLPSSSNHPAPNNNPAPSSSSIAQAPSTAAPISTSTPVTIEAPKSLPANKPNNNEAVDRASIVLPMMAVVSQSIRDELEAWRYIFATYKAPKEPSSSHKMLSFIGDTKQHFLHLMDTWLALGHTMIEHSINPDKQLSSEFVHKALQGMYLCAGKLVHDSYPHYCEKQQTILLLSNEASIGFGKQTAAPKSATIKVKVMESKSAKDFTSTSTLLNLPTSSSGKFNSTSASHHPPESLFWFQPTKQMHAMAVVYVLLCVQRLLSKNSNADDATNLLMLLRKIHEGELPVLEVSRDNFKDFLAKQLNLSLSWDKFDAICQRVDPDKKGFIAFSPCLSAFQHLHPLLDKMAVHVVQDNMILYHKLQPHLPLVIRQKYQDNLVNIVESTKQFSILMIFSVVTDNLLTHNAYFMEKKLAKEPTSDEATQPPSSPSKTKAPLTKPMSLDEIFFQIISRGQSSYPSFQKYMQQLNEKMYYMQNPFALKEVSVDQDKNSTQLNEAKLIEWQLFVTDLLFELSKPFVKNLLEIWRESKVRDKFCKFVGVESKSAFFVTAVQSITQNHYEVCTSVAKGLNIYNHLVVDGTEDILLPLTRLLMDSLLLRFVLLAPAVKPAATTTASVSPVAASDVQSLDLRGRIELWNDVAGDPLKLAGRSPTNVEAIADALATKLGLPIPIAMYPLHIQVDTKPPTASATSLLDLHRHPFEELQYQAESLRFFVDEFLQHMKTVQEDQALQAKVAFANSSTLKDLQQTLHKDLWQAKTMEEDAVNKAAVKKAKEESGSHLISKTNELLHQQRIEQITSYLEYLNQKATNKKKLLRSLLELWQSAKVFIEDQNLISSSNAKSMVNTDVVQNQTMSKDKKRQAALPKDVIVDQTRAIQDLLLKDMQKPLPTKIASLEERVNILRRGVQNIKAGTVQKDNEALTLSGENHNEHLSVLEAALLQVDSLQHSLLQANNDAMRISSRILQHILA